MDTHFHYIYIPAPVSEEGRTMLLLHGTGGNEKDMISLARQLDSKAALLSPRGKVSENGMARFFKKHATGSFDEDDIRFRAYELVEFIETAENTYSINSGSIMAVGYSNGANIATAILLLHPRVLNSAVLFRPMVPLVPENMPDLSGKHIFISAGQNDPLVSADDTRRLVDLLSNAGAEVSVHWSSGTHAINEEDVAAAKEWVDNGFHTPIVSNFDAEAHKG